MRPRALAVAGSAVFFVLAPGVVAGLIPFLITGWRFTTPFPYWGPLRVLGATVTGVAALFLISAFARFVIEGIGTPAPVAPTRNLVVGGVYRHVRNPMYIAVASAIVGQAMLFGQLSLLAWAALSGLAMVAFAHAVEEPMLLDRFGEQYEEYRREVPAWWPRLRPWKESHSARSRADELRR